MNKLEYGWWKSKQGNVQIPEYVGDDPRNYALTKDDLKAYLDGLMEMQEVVEAEKQKVRLNLKAIEQGHLKAWESNPRCTSLCDVLGFKVKLGRAHLKIMQALLASTSAYLERRNAKLS